MSAPPGWYPDAATGRTRWWDGYGWDDGANRGPTPDGQARRRRRRWIIAAVALTATLVVGVLGCTGGIFVLSSSSQDDFVDDTADLADRLLVPTDLGEGWEEQAAGALPPAWPPISPRSQDLDHVCPDARAELGRELDFDADLARRDSLVLADARLERPPTETEGAAFAGEAVLAFWLSNQADGAFAAHRRSRSCTETWAYTAPDGSVWTVRNETINPSRFFREAVVARTTYTPVDPDGPGGEPASSDTPTEYLNVVSRREEQILLLSTIGLTLEETEAAYRAAWAKLER